MRKSNLKYAFLLSLFFFSCNKDIVYEFDGNTSIDEKINYNKFSAVIKDVFAEKELPTRAPGLKNHIGYSTNDKPDLFVYFTDNDTQFLYQYNYDSLKYVSTDSEIKGDALYMTNSEDDTYGAIVAAPWPMEFNAIKDNPIELKNMKSRVRVSFKTLKTSGINVSSVSLGDVSNLGTFKLQGNDLRYIPDEDNESIISGIRVNDVISEIFDEDDDKNNYNYATYEVFVVPQILKAFDDYIRFGLGGSECDYFFKDNLTIEPNYLYRLVFLLEKSENDKVVLKLELSDAVADWENGGDMSLGIDPNNPIMSEWDGASVEKFKLGSGKPEDPYLIQNANQLAFFMKNGGEDNYKDKSYKLTINIDWKNYPWSPVGKSQNGFGGIFDGNGKLVKNINISNVNNNIGFFAFVGQQQGNYTGEVRNLTVKGDISVVKGSNPAWGNNFGGITGVVALKSKIENCHFKGKVKGHYRVGGIAGSNSGTIIGCSVIDSDVISEYSGDEYYNTNNEGVTGGIVGQCWSGTISHCLSLNNRIDGSSRVTGGINGLASNKQVQINNCFAHDLSFINVANQENKINGVSGTKSLTTNPTITSSYHKYELNKDVLYLEPSDWTSITNKLNGGDEEFVPGDETQWYWKANPGLCPSPVNHQNER